MTLQAFHVGYHVVGEENSAYTEVDYMDNGVWDHSDTQFQFNTASHARYLSRVGMGWGAGSFARDAFDVWDNRREAKTLTPFWTNGEWICVGTNAIQIELIKGVDMNPRLGGDLFHLQILPSVGNAMLDERLPLRDFERIFVEFRKACGWTEADAKKAAKEALHAPPSKVARMREQEWEQLEAEVLGRRSSIIQTFGDW